VNKLGFCRIIAFLWLIFPILLFSQVEEWVARYNGAGNGDECGNAITVDNQGNVYVAGYAPGSFLTIKYNSLGQKEWSDTYDLDSTDECAEAIAVDNTGNVYVTGHSHKPFVYWHCVTVKYTSSGVMEWAKIYNPEGDAVGRSIALDDYGNAYIAGGALIKYNPFGDEQWVKRFVGPDSILAGFKDVKYINGYIYATGDYAYTGFKTAKFDTSGQEIWWARCQGRPNSTDEFPSLAIDNQGNVYVAGTSQLGEVDYLIVKYDSMGQELWRRFYTLPYTHNWLSGVAVDRNSNVYVTGRTVNEVDDIDDILTLKYDPNGNLWWAVTYDYEKKCDAGIGIEIDTMDNVYICGFSFRRREEQPDYITIKYGANGEEQWVARYGSYISAANGLILDKNANVYVTGGSFAYNSSSAEDCVTIKYSTYAWTKTRPIPAGSNKKKVKYGGALVSVSPDKIFTLKGNKTNEFYSFDIINQMWISKQSIPSTLINFPVFVKKGGALTYGNGIIYATKGNNTNVFWAFDLVQDSWLRLANIRGLGSSTYLKGGTGLAYVNKADTDLVYLLKGSNTSNTNEFGVYYAAKDSWFKRAEAPILPSGKYYKDGSCIVYNGNNTIYALKSKTNEFYAYDINTDVWTEKQTLPLIGVSGKKKKVKSGGAMVWADSSIYAFKGGNTLEFWQYLPGSNTWVQKESLFAGEKKKRIKGGGALAYIEGKVYALKGNNTLEFWVYIPKQEMPGAASKFGAMAQTQGKKPINQINVYPNPFLKTTTLTYTLSQPGSFSIALYDISGRLLRLVNKETKSTNGSIILDFEGLNSGVYLLLFKSGEYKITKKVIMN
jgi:hypothetical protein